MNYSSINIQGNIVSSEVLDKIRSEEKFKYQLPEAFGLARTASLRDEIGLAWSIMRTHWQAYKKRIESLPKEDTGTTLTRQKWMIPLLSELGYQVNNQNAQHINGKPYAISHCASSIDNFPIHIMGYNDHLDKRRESGGPRLSPHALVQEYLNNTEHLYGLVTNGRQLRLLRDATRLVRMSYLEFDLERMFEEELYADFSILFRVLHASRMPEKMEEGPDSYIEFYHQESMASGSRIREKLSEAVESSIKTLANGFLEHSKNQSLTDLFDDEQISSEDYYKHQLRLIYRVLFLIVLEERKLVYPEDIGEEGQRFRDIYYKYYSIERLRKLTENRVYVDTDKYDLWESLKTTFLLFEQEEFGSKIGIKPLGSGLFAPDALGNLKEQFLSNGNLLEVLKRLTTFVSDQGTLVRVNYSDLDVEEFGSVYEGLLEYDPVVEKIGNRYQFNFVLGDDRSSSGSHYTPEELVKPLIKHSLDYIIEDKLKEDNPENALLSITVCDVACGSGHILLSAARKIATELASIREGAEQPSPTYYRAAIKDVIRNCIYGVDLNPLAVELCKVALWLEAHNPNEPLNFLDHHIKCGNAIVGLAHFEELENGIASEAFKTLPGDDKDIATTFKKENTTQRKIAEAALKSNSQNLTLDANVELNNSLQGLRKEFQEFSLMPEGTPEESKAKAKAYSDLIKGKKWYRLKNLADLQVAQFFIPKTLENKEKLTTDSKYRTYLNAGSQILDRGASMTISQRKRFFHWFLEFPEVFNKGGFDCILGNPPYIASRDINSKIDEVTHKFLKSYFQKSEGKVDFVSFFYRRDFDLIKNQGFLSLIATNSISQGDTRKASLEYIVKKSGVINFAAPSINWPGKASTTVSLTSIGKKINKTLKCYIGSEKVNRISSRLESISLDDIDYATMSLLKNKPLAFQGSILGNEAFKISEDKFKEWTSINPVYNNILFPFVTGDNLNDNYDHRHSTFVIDFQNKSLDEAIKFDEAFKYLNEKINNDKKDWWIHHRNRADSYKKIRNRDYILLNAIVSKYPSISRVNTHTVASNKNTVFNIDKSGEAILYSSIYALWVYKYTTTMRTAGISFSINECFNNFPLISNKGLEELAEQYYIQRAHILNKLKIGLTKFYNQIHNKKLSKNIDHLTPKEILKKHGTITLNFHKYISNNKELSLTFSDAVDLILEFRNLQVKLDKFVIKSYGWNEESPKWGKPITIEHDFYDIGIFVDNEWTQFTLNPDARKEILKRLLLLNHERFEEEVKQGLHKKKDVEAYYKQKNMEIPEGTEFSDKKSKAKKKAPKKDDNQGQMF